MELSVEKPWLVLSAALMILSAFSVPASYRFRRLGRLVHLVPYILWGAGTAFGMIGRPLDGTIGGLITLAVLAFMHGAVLYEIWREDKRAGG